MANIRFISIGNHITPQKAGKPLKNTPKLVLQGNWLQMAGFDVHTSVQVEVLNGVLTITKKGGANA
jgi:hypothetical protein